MAIDRVVAKIALLVLTAAAGFVLTQLANGKIRMDGLLSHKSGAWRDETSPARVQLLITTLTSSGIYLRSIAEWTDTTTLPAIDHRWLAVAIASNGVYSVGKTIRLALDRFKKSSS